MTVSREDEFEVLYRSMVPDVRRYVTAHVGRSGDVDDVVNATFTSVWQRFSDLPPESQRAWVLGVARNQCRNERRSTRRFGALVTEIVAARPRIESRMADQNIGIETIDAISRLLPRLSNDDRELLVLLGWLELSSKDAAAVVGISESAMRVRVHRLRVLLRAELDQAEGQAS